MNDDADLRERFASQRSEDAARVPPFGTLLQTAARPAVGGRSASWRTRRPTLRSAARPSMRFAAAAGIAFAAAGLLVWRFGAHEPAMHGSRDAKPLADWRSPTDFLLDTSGSAMLRDVPRIGDPRLNETAPIGRRAQERTT
jgi:hypothetical protein